MDAGIIRTTHPGLPEGVRDGCRDQLERVRNGLPMATVFNQPGEKPGLASIFRNILTGLEAVRSAWVFVVEHDVLYPGGYFHVEAEPEKGLTYARPATTLTPDGWVSRNHCPLSSLLARREVLEDSLLRKLADVDRGYRIPWSEPGFGDGFRSEVGFRTLAGPPVVDVRHGRNFTGMRRGRGPTTVEGWGTAAECWERFLGGVPEGKEETQMNADGRGSEERRAA
jgi:hypothetical protein